MTDDVPTQETLIKGVYAGIGGWWYRAGDGVPDQGPFLTAQKAQEAWDGSKPKKPKRHVVETSPEIVAKICTLLGVPMPDTDALEAFTVEMKAGEPVRVIQTFIAGEIPED